MLLKEAAEQLGVTKHFLYTEARAGRIPHFRAGNRYIFDVDQVDEFLKKKALESVREEKESPVQYGVLRRIEA
jgi:excisionase family DNA binding protein